MMKVKKTLPRRSHRVLLEQSSSSIVNCGVFVFFVLILCTVIVFGAFLNELLSTCAVSLQRVEENPWYNVTIGYRKFVTYDINELIDYSTTWTFLNAFLTMVFYNQGNWSFYGSTQEPGGLLPKCHWLTRKSQNYVYGYATNMSTALTPFNTTSMFEILDNYLGAESTSDVWFLLYVSSYLELYFNTTVDSGYAEDFLMECLLGKSSAKACDPCGIQSNMGIKFSPDNQSFMDLYTSGSLWYPISYLPWIGNRCFRQILFEMIAPCSMINRRLEEKTPSHFVENHPNSMSRNLVASSGGNTNDIINKLIGTLNVSGSAFWEPFDVAFAALENPSTRMSLISTCGSSNFSVLELIGSQPNHDFWIQTNPSTSAIRLCWQMYVNYFWVNFFSPEAPLSSCVEPASRYPAVNASSTTFYVAFMESYCSASFGYYSNYTTYANGYPLFPYMAVDGTPYQTLENKVYNFTLGSLIDYGCPFLSNESQVGLPYSSVLDPACTDFIVSSASEMETFLSEVGLLRDCWAASSKLTQANRATIFLYFGLGVAFLLVFFCNFVYIGRYDDWAQILVITFLFVSMASYIPVVVDASLTGDVENFILTQYVTIDTKLRLSIAVACVSSFYWAWLVFTLISLLSYLLFNERPPWTLIAGCTLYFICHGIICPFVFHTSVGLVPFVYWITLIRICNLADVSNFPECQTQVGNVYSYGSLPFYGIVFATICDLAATIAIYLAFARYREHLQKRSFLESRGVVLIWKLVRLISIVSMAGLMLSGIINVSLNNLIVTYIASVHWTPEGVRYSIDLRSTGVQEYWGGAYSLIFYFAVFLCYFFMPADRGLGRLLSSRLEAVRVPFIAGWNKSDVDSRGQSLMMNSLAESLYDGVVAFSLQSTIQTLFMSHSAYHIRENGVVCPPEYEELGTVYDEQTDTLVWIVKWRHIVYVSFRGTISAQNAKTDLAIKKKTLSWNFDNLQMKKKNTKYLAAAQEALLSTPECRVHRGFLGACSSVLGQIIDILDDVDSHVTTNIICTGHSLGGALGTIVGLFLACSFKPLRGIDVEVVTFGSPKVGDAHFAQFFHSKIPSCFRVIQRGDPVTKTPFTLPLPKFLNYGYTHVGVCVVCEVQGDLIVDPTVLDMALLHNWNFSGVREHSSNAYLIGMLAFVARCFPYDIEIPKFENCEHSVFHRSAQYFAKDPKLLALVSICFEENDKSTNVSGYSTDPNVTTTTSSNNLGSCGSFSVKNEGRDEVAVDYDEIVDGEVDDDELSSIKIS